jgi:phosphomannomutase/phosphoglucomutase
MEVFGSSGVRGVVGEEMTPEFVLRIARAAGGRFHDDGLETVAVGRDTRLTGQMLADAASAGLSAVGCDVRRLGIVPTPGLQAYCADVGMPGLVITASHNPPSDNGVKLVGADGSELSLVALERIEARLLADRQERPTSSTGWRALGAARPEPDVAAGYVEKLVAAEEGSLADADLTVAIDPGHGAGALTSPDLFRRLGCRVITLNAQPDGRFPGRDPEPVASNLGDLATLVRTSAADIGIAHDGDADRAMFVDETGAFVEGDVALAVLARASLGADDVTVSAVNVSQRLVEVADAAGADLELTPIGSTHIVTRIRELQQAGERVPIAGEGNGGVLFPSYRLARDGAYTAMRLVALVAERPLGELVEPFDGYANVKLSLSLEHPDDREAMLGAIERYANEADAEVTTIDGYRLDYGDGWVLARPSGTEPLMRLSAEAAVESRAQELAAGLETAMRDAIE